MLNKNVENTTKKQLGGITGKGFMPGESGNPNGRPPGSGISITSEIKKKLAEVPEGQKATYLQLLINRIMKQAIQDGDQQMITRIWQYIDGMPLQKTEVGGLDGEPFKLNVLAGLGFIPAIGQVNEPSKGSIVSGQSQIQDNNLAQESKEINNGTV